MEDCAHEIGFFAMLTSLFCFGIRGLLEFVCVRLVFGSVKRINSELGDFVVFWGLVLPASGAAHPPYEAAY
jgi:hypothetical protein